MDDLTLMHQLAALMGWTVVGPQLNRRARHDFSGDEIYVDEQGQFWRGIKANGNATVPWCPLEDMNDAMMVVGKMRKDSYDYEIGSCLCEGGEGHFAMFMRGVHDLYDDTWEETHEAVAPSPARAICLAALATEEASHANN